MPIKICVATSTRADYGILSPLLKRLDTDERFTLTIAVTGTHLEDRFGHTVDEIEKDGFAPERVPIMDVASAGHVFVSDIMANALGLFGRFFSDRHFDLLVVLGDRSEMAAIACAAVNARLPIAHIAGGETSEGAIDECYRHAITKMSLLHFPSCETYRRRVIQLGEDPSRVFNVGSLSVENILNAAPYPMDKLSAELALPLESAPYAVVTFHPVTQESGTAMAQLHELMAAMQARDDLLYIITKANADEDGDRINAEWETFARENAHCRLVASLGMQRYLSAVKNAVMVLGNSSSGIIEAPVCRVPTVNIGDRQKGRLRTESIIDCAPVRKDILAAMEKACDAPFVRRVKALEIPYGDGDTARRIVTVLKEEMTRPLNVKKKFYDLPMA